MKYKPCNTLMHIFQICAESGAILEDYQIRTYYMYGGERVFITKAEMQTMKTLDVPGKIGFGFSKIGL